ncbi:unnamed protein product [Trichobilharzia regenti]|nr:unnamed protein product [Trichobilharzia regenti]
MAIGFIYCLKRLKTDAAFLNVNQLSMDPYSNKKLRKIIDTLAYDVYSQWVKKGEEQNRAALFENAPRRDLIDVTSIYNPNNSNNLSPRRSIFAGGGGSMNYTTFNYDDDDDDDLRVPIRIEY